MAHHNFVPDHYHITIGAHDPVLHISPGDSVSTTTVDARGRDFTGEQITERGNPMTGPFFIDGAEVGDALAIKFDRLWPNRDWGFSGTTIAPNVLEPGYDPDLNTEVETCKWAVDLTAGNVRLVEPETKLSQILIPISPMLGCFGVAPPRGQSISTGTSSTYGGNMDYRGFIQGTTVFLPVAEPGGLFHLGDGHALQGDGEIVGTGIEISFDVTFSVDLIKNSNIGWPRAENDTHIMVAGNARPLDQCVQHATTELVKWIESDYDLDPIVVHQVLGQFIEYDMGNVYDPAYTMVGKIEKEILERISS
jgi:acetamidase/formamidase